MAKSGMSGPSLGDAVSIVALLSTFSFIISGVTHFLIFKRHYEINYFSIASPSDIIIGGFAVLTMIGVTTVLVLILAFPMTAILRKFRTGTFQGLFNLPATAWKTVFVLAVVLATLNVWAQSVWGRSYPDPGTGLAISRDSEVREPCKGAAVTWVGSDAIVASCFDGFRIFRDFEKIEMVPWVDRMEAEIRAEAEAKR